LIEDHFSSGFKLKIISLMGILFVILNLVSFASQRTVERHFSNDRISTAKVIYVSKIGDNSDGSNWRKAYHTIQAALSAVPDEKGGYKIIIRPDTYTEANLYPSYKGAAGSYNDLIGDYDGNEGSGSAGWVVIDSGDPGKGFKSHDWWGTMKATVKGYSPEYTDETFSGLIWDRWKFRNLYVTGGDAGLFWDMTDKSGSEFSVIVEDCVSIGRAFGGGVAGMICRKDEPVIFRRTYLISLDWWGDAGAAYIRAHHKEPCDNYDIIFDDCTLVAPDNAIQGGNYGFDVYSRIMVKNCRLIVTNFSQPVGKPSTGIINVKEKGEYLHVDLEDCSLMGYKVFGVGDNQDKSDIPYTIKGRVRAYIQYQQDIPEGMERVARWPVEVFNSIGRFRIREKK
jgi:hypothetical protein